MGQRAHFHDCVSGDDVKGCLHVFAHHVVVVLQDWWDAFLVLGQLLNSQCFNTHFGAEGFTIIKASEVLWKKSQ